MVLHDVYARRDFILLLSRSRARV